MKGIKTLKKSINVKDAPAGTTVDFVICVKQIDKGTLKTRVEGVSDENAILTLFIFCVEALQEQYNYKDKDLMKTLMVMLEDDFYDDEED